MAFTSVSTIVNDMPWINYDFSESESFGYNQSYHFNDTWAPDNLLLASRIFQAFVGFLYFVIFVVAVFGNGLLYYIVHKTPSMKMVSNLYLVNLAAADILIMLFCVPFSFVSKLMLRYWPFGAIMCKVVNFLQAVATFANAYTTVVIAVDRYIVVMYPLKPRVKKATAKMIMAGVWIGGLITAAPIPFVSQLLRPSPWHTKCEVDICAEEWADVKQGKLYTGAVIVVQFVIPLMVLVFTYGPIAYTVWRRRVPGEAYGARVLRIRQSTRKVIKLMAVGLAEFIICCSPLNIFLVKSKILESGEQWATWPGMPYVWFACHWLAMAHSCYNPIICFYMNADFRRGFKEVLGRLPCLKFNGRRTRNEAANCDGISMSEMVGVNVSTIPKRNLVGNKCHLSTNSLASHSSGCTTSASQGHPKILGPRPSSMAMAHPDQITEV